MSLGYWKNYTNVGVVRRSLGELASRAASLLFACRKRAIDYDLLLSFYQAGFLAMILKLASGRVL